MGTYIDGIIKHNFDVSSGEALAQDLSQKLRVNIRYVFLSEFNESMKLYHQPVSEDDVYIVIKEYICHQNAPWFDLEDDEYFKKYVLEKHGEQIFFEHYYKQIDDLNERGRIIQSIKDAPIIYFFSITDKYETEESELDYNFNIFSSYITICNIIDVRWWDLVDSFLFTGIDHYNYFEEDRNKIKKLCHLLGVEEIYLTADNGRGVGIPENRNYTWDEAEIVLRTEAGDLFIDISKVAANKIIYLPLDNDREYPKLLYDDFTELSSQERFILGDKIFFKDFNSGYSNHVSSLTSCMFSDNNPNLEKVIQLKNELEEAMKNVVANSSKLAYVNTLYAFVHYWNNELEIVNDLQTTFLKESLIYKNGSVPKYKTAFNNFNIVEDYLYLIFSSCNYPFIEKLIKEYPFIPSYFYLSYNNYLKYIEYENVSISERQQLSYKESRIDVYFKKYWQPIYGLSINEKLLQAMINKQYSKELIYRYINAGGNVKYFSKKGYNALTKVIENYWSRYLPYYPGNIEIMKQYEHVKFLVELGVDVNFTDKEGFTSLYYAFKNLNYKVFELLLQYGVDVNFLQQNTHTILFHINQEISWIKTGARPSSAYSYLNEMKSLSLKYGGEEISVS